MTGCLRLAVVAAALVAGAAEACTGFYVGKRVSADGTTLIGRTVDLPALWVGHRVAVVPRVENVPGRTYTGPRGFVWNFPATTWKYVATPRLSWEQAGDFASCAANEKGLAITATVTGYVRDEITKAFPPIKTGCAEENLTTVLAACCESAVQAVDLIGEIMAKYGTNERNIVLLADARETWLVEIYTGHLWAAMRLPEDKVAAFGNNFVLGVYDPGSPDWKAAPDIASAPEAKGLAVHAPDGRLDLFHTYSGRRYQYANIRNWFARRHLAPGTEGEYSDGAEFPLIYAPGRKIGPADLMAVMRTRYEGTEWCPETNGRDNIRVIGIESQSTCHILSVRDDLPAERAITIWACLGPAEHSVFLPLASCIDRVDDGFARDWTERRSTFNPSLACDAFRRLAALCQVNRKLYGNGVRDFWAARERELQDRWPAVYARGDAAEMTAFVCREQRRAMEDASRMHDEIEWEIASNGLSCRYKQKLGVWMRRPDPQPYAPSATNSYGIISAETKRQGTVK